MSSTQMARSFPAWCARIRDAHSTQSCAWTTGPLGASTPQRTAAPSGEPRARSIRQPRSDVRAIWNDVHRSFLLSLPNSGRGSYRGRAIRVLPASTLTLRRGQALIWRTTRRESTAPATCLAGIIRKDAWLAACTETREGSTQLWNTGAWIPLRHRWRFSFPR
jgi:hypothetical protein